MESRLPSIVTVLPPSKSASSLGRNDCAANSNQAMEIPQWFATERGRVSSSPWIFKSVHYASCPDGLSAALCFISFAIRNPESWYIWQATDISQESIYLRKLTLCFCVQRSLRWNHYFWKLGNKLWTIFLLQVRKQKSRELLSYKLLATSVNFLFSCFIYSLFFLPSHNPC